MRTMERLAGVPCLACIPLGRPCLLPARPHRSPSFRLRRAVRAIILLSDALSGTVLAPQGPSSG